MSYLTGYTSGYVGADVAPPLTEDERAALHRRQAKARTRYRKSQERALKGDAARAKAVRDAWKPVANWARGK